MSLVLLAVFPSAALMQRGFPAGTRSVRPVADANDGAPAFDPEQSAGLFVGVRQFDSSSIAQVPYGVDDAVDLAFTFAMDPRVALVDAKRVVLALSDGPLKKLSKDRLAALRDAGATIIAATRVGILQQLHQQTSKVGRDGLLVVAFATHGYTHDGVPYVLARTSDLERPDTAISTVRVLEVASTSRAARSLILVDACRDRVKSGTRTVQSPEPFSGAPVLEVMTRSDGQAVLYAAAAGKYAYDNDQRRNGVFTAAVLDGIHCKAALNAQGLVTVDALAAYVDREVHAWVRAHRPADESYDAIQASMDGGTRNMPLARCGDVRAPGSPRLPHPSRVDVAGDALTVYDDRGSPLFEHQLPAPIARAELVDLDADGHSEVVVAAGGMLRTYSASGELSWSTADLGVTTFTSASLYDNKSREIVALSNAADGSTSRVTILDGRGRVRSVYGHPGRLENVVVDRRTARHAARIIVVARNDTLHADSVFMLDPNRAGSSSQLWYGVIRPAGQRIAAISITDFDDDGTRDISVRTEGGTVFHLDFEGRILATQGPAPAPFGLIASR